jgi:hypothetical protein
MRYGEFRRELRFLLYDTTQPDLHLKQPSEVAIASHGEREHDNARDVR